MAEKASAGNDYRNEGVEGLEEQRWYRVQSTANTSFRKDPASRSKREGKSV